MKLPRKEIARPGTVTYINESTGRPEKLRITPYTTRYWADQGNAMLEAGLSVPIPFEHQKDAKPLTAAERKADQLKNNAGWISRYELGEVTEKVDGKDVVVNDVLFGVPDIQDQTVADKLPTTIRYTSPWITSFTDGAGKKWDSVIGHVALTTRPRLIRQEPFAPNVAAALSLIDHAKTQEFIPDLWSGGWLTSAGYVGADGKPAKPLSCAFSLGINLAEDEEKKMLEEEEKGTERAEKPPVSTDKTPQMPKPHESAPPGDMQSDSAVSIHQVIGDLLRASGVHCPEGMSQETFENDVYQAAMEAVQRKCAEHTQKQRPQGRQQMESQNPVIQEQPQMYASLSLEDANRLTDPKEKSIALSFVEMRLTSEKAKKRADALEKAALATAKVKRDQRIEAIGKRFGVADRDALLAMSNECQLSLSDDGVVVDPMDKQLKLIEAAFKQVPNVLLSGAVIDEQPHPTDSNGLSEDRRKFIVDKLAKSRRGNGATTNDVTQPR